MLHSFLGLTYQREKGDGVDGARKIKVQNRLNCIPSKSTLTYKTISFSPFTLQITIIFLLAYLGQEFTFLK